MKNKLIISDGDVRLIADCISDYWYEKNFDRTHINMHNGRGYTCIGKGIFDKLDKYFKVKK